MSTFSVIQQEGTASNYNEQGRSIIRYGVVYYKPFCVTLQLPFSFTLIRLDASLCFDKTLEDVPKQGDKFPLVYEPTPSKNNDTQFIVSCTINVLSSHLGKSHFRIRYRLANPDTNQIYPNLTVYSAPIWVVSKPGLTGGKKMGRTRKEDINPLPRAPTVPILPQSDQIYPSDQITSILERIIKIQEDQQKQIDILTHKKKRKLEESESDVEKSFEKAFNRLKRFKRSNTDNVRIIAEKFSEDIKDLYQNIPSNKSSNENTMDTNCPSECSDSNNIGPLNTENLSANTEYLSSVYNEFLWEDDKKTDTPPIYSPDDLQYFSQALFEFTPQEQ